LNSRTNETTIKYYRQKDFLLNQATGAWRNGAIALFYYHPIVQSTKWLMDKEIYESRQNWLYRTVKTQLRYGFKVAEAIITVSSYYVPEKSRQSQMALPYGWQSRLLIYIHRQIDRIPECHSRSNHTAVHEAIGTESNLLEGVSSWLTKTR
jgi:hypothetical protein